MDELDQRVRALEAERMRPMPPEPPRSRPVTPDTDAETNLAALADAVGDTETRAEAARRIRADTGSLRAVMDELGVTYADAKQLTEETS